MSWDILLSGIDVPEDVAAVLHRRLLDTLGPYASGVETFTYQHGHLQNLLKPQRPLRDPNAQKAMNGRVRMQ